jgi:hypothetical protein
MGTYGSKEDNNGHVPEDISIPTKVIRPPAPLIDNSARMPDENITQLLTENSESLVPTVFKWEHGGKHVYITGTFNNWERQIPMHRSGNDFTYVHNLKRGKHAFKFIVDDEWRFAPDQPTIADVEGQINNFIDVSEFVPYVGDDNFFLKSKDRKVPDEEFKQNIPDLDEYTKE